MKVDLANPTADLTANLSTGYSEYDIAPNRNIP